MAFQYSIKSFDFHTYFKLGDKEQEAQAEIFKKSIENEFKEELEQGSCRLFKTFMRSIGPHPDGYGMFEADTRSPETFLKLLNYYQTHHGDLSVLIHPRSDASDLIDHTTRALWLGKQANLKTHFLEDH